MAQHRVFPTSTPAGAQIVNRLAGSDLVVKAVKGRRVAVGRKAKEGRARTSDSHELKSMLISLKIHLGWEQSS